MLDMQQVQSKLLQTMNQAWPCLPQAKAQLNPLNQGQPLMYSFILLNIAQVLFTKSKPKRLTYAHDLVYFFNPVYMYLMKLFYC